MPSAPTSHTEQKSRQIGLSIWNYRKQRAIRYRDMVFAVGIGVKSWVIVIANSLGICTPERIAIEKRGPGVGSGDCPTVRKSVASRRVGEGLREHPSPF